MSGGTDHSTSKRSSKRRDGASPMLLDYIKGGPATATEQLAAGHKSKKGGTKDRESQMKKQLKEWDRQWKATSS